jgi:hypothetical protein
MIDPEGQPLEEQLHQDFVVLTAVYHDLPRQTAAFGEAKPAIEGLSLGVGSPDLDYEFLIPRFAGEGHGCLPQLVPNTSPAPGWQEERPHLADMRHRLEHRGPALQDLEANDAVGDVHDDVYDLSCRERFQVSSLLFDSPDAVDRGMHPLINDDGEDGHDSGSVLQEGAPNFQSRLKWPRQDSAIQA